MTTTRSGRLWPWFIGALLAATVVAQAIMLYAATHDATFAVVPDYYARGLAFDSTIAQERRNLMLGWRASAAFAPAAAGTTVSVRLADQAGAPVAGATVRAELISNLDASHPLEIALTADGEGSYVATTQFLRRGLWDVRLDALKGGERFTPVMRVEYAP